MEVFCILKLIFKKFQTSGMWIVPLEETLCRLKNNRYSSCWIHLSINIPHLVLVSMVSIATEPKTCLFCFAKVLPQKIMLFSAIKRVFHKKKKQKITLRNWLYSTIYYWTQKTFGSIGIISFSKITQFHQRNLQPLL